MPFNTVLNNINRLAKQNGQAGITPAPIPKLSSKNLSPLDPCEIVLILKDQFFQPYYKNGNPMKPRLIFAKDTTAYLKPWFDGNLNLTSSDGGFSMIYDVQEDVDFEFIQ